MSQTLFMAVSGCSWLNILFSFNLLSSFKLLSSFHLLISFNFLISFKLLSSFNLVISFKLLSSKQQYQFTPTHQFSTQVLPTAGPCSIGGGTGGSSLDVGQMGLAPPRNSLGDVSFSSLLRGATYSLSPSDNLNVPIC